VRCGSNDSGSVVGYLSKRIGKNLRESSVIRHLTSTSCGDIFRSWTARQARSQVRTNLAAEMGSKLATFSRQSLGVRHSAEYENRLFSPIRVEKQFSG
jgi:hypothetical protein